MELTVQIDFSRIDLTCNQIIYQKKISQGRRQYYMNVLFKIDDLERRLEFSKDEINYDIVLFEAKYRNASYALYLFKTSDLNQLDCMIDHLDSREFEEQGMYHIKYNQLKLNLSDYHVLPGFWFDSLFNYFKNDVNPEKLTNLLGGEL